MNLTEEVLGALARGYATQRNEHKTLDPDLLYDCGQEAIKIAKQYAKEMCEKQKNICADEYCTQDIIRHCKYDVKEDVEEVRNNILNSPLAIDKLIKSK